MRIHVREPFPSLTHARTRVREVEREKEKGRRYFVSHAICRQPPCEERKGQTREREMRTRGRRERSQVEREKNQ